MSVEQTNGPAVNRRQLLQAAAGAAALGAGARLARGAAPARQKLRGNINHSIVYWCFQDYWSVEQTCRVARQLGCKSVELVEPEHWPTLKKYGLVCALTGSHLFMQGMNNPSYQPMCLELMRKRIDACADAGFPTVITFTGYARQTGPWAGGANPDLDAVPPDQPVIDPEEGVRNCIAGFKKIVGYAEKKGINLALEMLNTRVTDHPMKGHPGYQGDHIDYCMRIIEGVGSPRLGLLFDIYHVQIMDGDLIRRIRQCKDVIVHVHTAGNPGRGELDENQEINYRPVMKALHEVGYQGFVGHEFIPTRDPAQGLAQAVSVCDV